MDNYRFSEEHGGVAKLLRMPLDEYPPSANEDDLLHDIASNPIHAFKLIHRLRRVFMGKVLPMIRTKWPKGKTIIFDRSIEWHHSTIDSYLTDRDVTLRADLLQFVERLKSGSSFPSDADLHGMAVSLNRIQSIYSLDVRDLTIVRIST